MRFESGRNARYCRLPIRVADLMAGGSSGHAAMISAKSGGSSEVSLSPFLPMYAYAQGGGRRFSLPACVRSQLRLQLGRIAQVLGTFCGTTTELTFTSGVLHQCPVFFRVVGMKMVARQNTQMLAVAVTITA